MNMRFPFHGWGWILASLLATVFGLGILSQAGNSLGSSPPPRLSCNSDIPVLFSSLSDIVDVKADGQSIFILASGDPGILVKISRASGRQQDLIKVRSEPLELMVDNRSVYWVESPSGPGMDYTLYRATKSGSRIQALWGSKNLISQLGFDRDNLYWLERDTGSLLRISRKGGLPETLVSGVEDLYYSYIYDGTIYLAGTGWVGRFDPVQHKVELIATAEQIIQDLEIGLRPDYHYYAFGPFITAYQDMTLLQFDVANNPGMISCTDNFTHIVTLPRSGNLAGELFSVAGDLRAIAAYPPYLYTIGQCYGGQMLNMDTGVISPIDEIEPFMYRMAVDKTYIYWGDDRGLACMKRPGK